MFSQCLGSSDQMSTSAIRERIQDTPGVLSILSFDTNYDGTSRRVTFTSSIDTIYGQTTVTSEA